MNIENVKIIIENIEFLINDLKREINSETECEEPVKQYEDIAPYIDDYDEIFYDDEDETNLRMKYSSDNKWY